MNEQLNYGTVVDMKEDEPKHRFVSKGAFDNKAFDALSDPPVDGIGDSISGSHEFSIHESESPKEEKKDCFTSIENYIQNLYNNNKRNIKRVIVAVIFLLYNIYLGFAIWRTWESSCSWCDNVKFLIIITAIVYFFILYYVIIKKYILKPLGGIKAFETLGQCLNHRYVPWVTWILIGIAITIFLIIDTSDNRYRLISAGGLIVLILLGYVFSAHRRNIIWNQVFWGTLLQFVFGLLILRWDVGRDTFECLGNKISSFLEHTNSGSGFVFSYLVTGKMEGGVAPQPAVFAFKVLSVVLFFSFCTSILYYYGVMQVFVMKVGWFLQKTVGTTACESMNAAGNIFLGMTEAPLLIKPFLPIMTKSEIHAVMTGGFATIAGSVLAAYIEFGVSASHLLSASVMSAPAALAYSKLFYPETEESKTHVKDIKIDKGQEQNALEAASNGVSSSISLVANIAANLIAFLAAIHFFDSVIQWFGLLLGYDYITFEWILSKLFIPLSLLMGVEWNDCEGVARLIGLKTVVNEFVAYKRLGELTADKKLSLRSQGIATYALCGFSNIGSIGIQLGGLCALAPDKKSEIASVAVRAMIAGSAACFMTACVAGTLMQESVG